MDNVFAGFVPASGEEKSPADKPKARKPRKAKVVVSNTDALAKTLQGFHVTLAYALKIEELAIDGNESKSLADALDGVMAEFDIQISPATQALANLAMAAGSIYIPRIVMIKMKKQAMVKDSQQIDDDMTEETTG